MEYLIRLWGFCQSEQRGQCLGTATAEDVELLCAWDDEPGKLFSALVASKWLDKNDDGTIEVHDWDEHNRGLKSNWANGQKLRRKVASSQRKCASTAPAVVGQCPSSAGATNSLLFPSIQEGGSGGEDDAAIPSEAEVQAFADGWAGDLSRGASKIPRGWLSRWFNWRMEKPQNWPQDWRGDLLRRFKADFDDRRPDALGITGSVNANGKKTPFALRAELEAVEKLMAEHPANPQSTSSASEPTTEQTEGLLALQKRRKEILMQLAMP
jgi:hypothetical protein